MASLKLFTQNQILLLSEFILLRFYLFPSSTTRLAIPSCKASLESTGRPVRMMSKALLRPINAGNRTIRRTSNTCWAFLSQHFSFRYLSHHQSMARQIFDKILQTLPTSPQLSNHKQETIQNHQQQHIH